MDSRFGKGKDEENKVSGTSSGRKSSFSSVKNAYLLVRDLYVHDKDLGDSIRNAYLAGMKKREIIDTFMPYEVGKSYDVAEMVVNDILEEIPLEERKAIAVERQIENLHLDDSQHQSERGKRGGLKKILHSEEAKDIAAAFSWTEEEKTFAIQKYAELASLPRDERCKVVAHQILEAFGRERTLSSVRGVVARNKTLLTRGLDHPNTLRVLILKIWDERDQHSVFEIDGEIFDLCQKTLGKSYEVFSEYLLKKYKVKKSARAIEGIIKWRNAQEKKKGE